MSFKNHELVPEARFTEIRYGLRPVRGEDGAPVEGLHAVEIALDNPSQLNSYTTSAVKELILAFRRASCDRRAVAVVFTGTGDKAFCTGGNTKEYAEYYAGQPHEYLQYMRLFNDMVTTILHCDKPVICRVNGMRIAGGQEIGMACDFSVAQDLARFGQAGPKHGSAPDGGSTDFLALFVGIERAMHNLTACEPWSAHKAYRLGLLTDVVPGLKLDGAFVPNPMVWLDGNDHWGRPRYGEYKAGPDRDGAKAMLAQGEVDLTLLDERVDQLVTSMLTTMPDCLRKTIESTRKHKLAHWDRNRESNRSWLSLNMMTEARAGFRAFNEGTRGDRDVDWPELRRRLADGEQWGGDLIRATGPKGLR